MARIVTKQIDRKLFYTKRVIFDYFVIILLSSFVLLSQFALNDQQNISYIDALFTSTSALTDTSIVTVNVFEKFNFFGQFIILALIQIGGIGIMAFKIFIFLLIRRKINIANRMMVLAEQNLSFKSGVVKILKTSFKLIILLEIIFAVIFSLHMYFNYDYDILKSAWFGVFHSISSFNNAGFTLTSNSLILFKNDYLFLTYTMFLIVIGGLGFPFLYDIRLYFKNLKLKKTFRFSLFSKINIITYFLVTLIGFICIFTFEFSHNLNNLNIHNVYTILFQVVSSRSAGFYTMHLNDFSQSSNLVLMILMFIGASPASSGGGIRTTTFAVIILYLISFMKNKKKIEVFNRSISDETVLKACITLCVSVALISTSIYLIALFNPNLDLFAISFDAVSAFGTSGLSLEIAQYYSVMSKLIIIILMIVGQLGIANTLLFFTSKKDNTSLIKSIEEEIIIG